MSRTQFLLAAVALVGVARAAAAAPLAILSEFQGKVTISRGGAALTARAGLPLEAGDRVVVSGGSATIFSLSAPPRLLRGTAQYTVGGAATAPARGQSMWKGVYEGVRTGFASRGKRVAATVRPGSLEAVAPPASGLLETRPRFSWSVGSLDRARIQDYLLEVRTAEGKLVWSAVTAETSLAYPPDQPPLSGALLWQVTPRTTPNPAAPGATSPPVAVADWATTPVAFTCALPAQAAELKTELTELRELLAGSPVEVSEVAAAALLYQRGYFVEAAARLEPINTESARVLLRDVYLQSGQLVQLRALDLATAVPVAPAELEPVLQAALNFPQDALPEDGTRLFTAPDGAFAVRIPSRWGALHTTLPSGGQFYQWTLLNWPRLSMAVVPARPLGQATPKLLEEARLSGTPIQHGAAVPEQFQGRPAVRTPWILQDGPTTLQGDSVEVALDGKSYVFSRASIDREAPAHLALGKLWQSLQFGVPPREDALPQAVAPDRLQTLFQEYLKEMQDAVTAMGEINQASTRRVTANPTADQNLPARLLAAPQNSRERAELADAAALFAGAKIWQATLEGNATEAAEWTGKREEYSRQAYASIKGFYQAEMDASDARLQQLAKSTPPVWTASSLSILQDMLHDLQASRAGDLMAHARSAGDTATERAMAQKRLLHRRAQLAPSLLITDARPARLMLQVLDVVGEMAYVAESEGEYDKARAIYRRTAALRQEVDASPSERKVDKPWRDLAALEGRAGNVEASFSAYQRALTELELKKPGRLQEIEAAREPELKEVLLAELWQSYSVAYNNLAILEQSRGNYQAAEALFQKALQSLEPLPTTGFAGRIRESQRARSLSNLGALKADSGQTAAARKLFLESSTVLRALGEDGQAAVTLLNLAGLRHHEEERASVRQEVETALALFRQTRQIREMLLASGFLARLDLEEKKPREAGQRLEEALQLARTRGDLDSIASIARLLARARLAAQPATRPLTSQQLSGAFVALSEAEAADEKSGSSTSRISTQTVRAELQEAAGELAAATGALGNAILRLEAIRATAASDESFSEDKSNFTLYERMVKLLLAQGKTEEAFDYMSRARSKKLQDNLRLGSLKSPDPALQRLLERAAALDTRLREVRSQLDAEKARPEKERDAGRVQTLANLVAATQAEFFTVAAGIKDKFPAYEKVVSVKPKELRKAQRALPEGSLLLQYAPLGDSLYIFVVTRDELKIYNPPVKPADLNLEIRRYRKFMDEAQAAVQAGKPLTTSAALQASSSKLYEMLLSPVQQEIDAAKTLAIIPTGELYYLPFHALSRLAQGTPRYLIQDRPVAYLAAADVLAVVQSRDAATWGTGLLALGNPPGANLPAAAEEVRAIAQIYPASQALTGAQASKSVLFQTDTQGRRVLHLAAHGVLDAAQPDKSYIQLAPSGAEDDGRLRLGEVYGLRLDKVDLVTLSACRTALGEGQPDGSEITSLAESFSSAGAPTVLATLWSVEDQSTRVLMEGFYTGLADGTPKAEALRKAQIALLVKPATAHPFYWAPFELLGDWR